MGNNTNNTVRHNRKIYKLYKKQIESYFPILTRREKSYINSCNIYNIYSVDKEISLEELYETYGRPEDIFSGYLNVMDEDILYLKIKRTKVVKKISMIILISSIIILGFCCFKAYKNYVIYKDTINITDGYWMDIIE